MAKKGIDLDKMVPALREKLDKVQDRFIHELQDQLAHKAPYETGRLASSWRIGKGSPNREVEPERTTDGGIKIKRASFPVTFGEDYYLSSNIPYADRLALDPSFPIKTAPRDWFTSTINQAPQLARRIAAEELRNF